MVEKKHIKWVLFIIAGILIFSSINILPKESVADVDGKACVLDVDCPCWGQLNETSPPIESYGLGVSQCVSGVCDTTYCVDVEPVAVWLKENPWAYLKENPLLLGAIVVLILVGLIYPK